jgi:hypothetical protein
MTKHFVCEPFREKDENGVLQAAGAHWTEAASLRNNLFARLAVIFACVVIGIYILFTVAMLGSSATPALAVESTLLFFLLKIAFGPLPERSVILHRDGKIDTPHGLPREKKVRRLRFHQPEIVSIEVIGAISGLAQDWTSSVALITGDGHTIPVGAKLHAEEAREVAVALTMALRDMRAAVRAPQVPVTAPRPVRRAAIR